MKRLKQLLWGDFLVLSGNLATNHILQKQLVLDLQVLKIFQRFFWCLKANTPQLKLMGFLFELHIQRVRKMKAQFLL